MYFDVSKFESFGSLSNYSRGRDDRPRAGKRGGHVDDPNKRHPLDFVLWHPSADDEPSWDTMWGPGRPGWHIECSALALRELGTTIDLHGGGTDLIFPHHECERAQSEAATGEPFVKHWMHTCAGREGRREDVEEPRQPRVRRQAAHRVGSDGRSGSALIEHHYRTEWEWDDELMPRNAERLRRWRDSADGVPSDLLEEVRERLDDDLDTPGCGGRRRRRRGCEVRTRGLLPTLLGVQIDAPG